MRTWEELEFAVDSVLDADGPLTIAGITFYPSRILREMDEIAYGAMLNDYADSEGIDTDDLE